MVNSASHRPTRVAALAAASVLLLAGCNWVERASVASDGAQGDALSTEPDLSASGRYLVFVSAATTFGANPAGHTQVWWRDTLTKQTRLASGTGGCAGAGCVGGNGPSQYPAVSADGRYVVFSSTATDLVEGGTTDEQVYRADMQTGTHQVVSVTPARLPGNDRSTLAFRTVRTPYGNETVGQPMSADGDRIAFRSDATDLGGGAATGLPLFVHTVSTGTTVRLSTLWNGYIHAYDLSDDGSTVAVTTADLDPLSPYSRVDIYDAAAGGAAKLKVLDRLADLGGGEVLVHGAIDGDGSHVLVSSDERKEFGDFETYRLFDLSSGSAVETAFGYTDLGFNSGFGGGIALDLDPAGQRVLIRSLDETFLCPTEDIQGCLEQPPAFPALTALGLRVPHTHPAMSDDGRVVAWVTDGPAASANDTNGLADVYVSGRPVSISNTTLDGPLSPGGSATLAVTGSGFAPGETTVTVGGRSSSSFTLSRLQVLSETELTLAVKAGPSLAPGRYDVAVLVANPMVAANATTLTVCRGCITVTP